MYAIVVKVSIEEHELYISNAARTTQPAFEFPTANLMIYCET